MGLSALMMIAVCLMLNMQKAAQPDQMAITVPLKEPNQPSDQWHWRRETEYDVIHVIPSFVSEG